MELEPGTVVAQRYRISRPLGRGGMGEVFAAENVRTGRPVAVKLLRSESKSKSSAVERFRREARAAGSINSDHVTQVLDVEEDAEHGIVLVFELLEGESLIERLKRTGPIEFDELFHIIEQVWLGLADAHRAGIIHRDLKPSNVFLEHRPDGTTRVKILDFGISKLPKEMSGGETLTEMGQSLGTFSFMPPEQIGKAKMVDHRADIYAAATLIYQALTGQLPYLARNILVLVEMKSKTSPRTLKDALGHPVDPRLEAFVAKCLAREPSARFQSAAEALSVWRELKVQRLQPEARSSQAPPFHSSHPAPAPSSALQSAISVPSSSIRIDELQVEPTMDETVSTVRMQRPARAPVGGRPAPPPPAPQPQSDPKLSGGTLPMTHAQPVAPAQAAPPRPQAGTTTSTGPEFAVPRMFEDDPPTSTTAAKTRIYRRPGSEAPGPSAPPPVASAERAPGMIPQSLKATVPRGLRAPASSSRIPLLVGAIAFALVGFGVVALALQYLRNGTPW